MKREKTVTAYTCDCCGAEIDDKAPISLAMRCDGEVWYEWWACGDYCPNCGAEVVNGA